MTEFETQYKLIRLKAQYEVLSSLEGLFKPKTTHLAAAEIDKKMRTILSEIETLEKSLLEKYELQVTRFKSRKKVK